MLNGSDTEPIRVMEFGVGAGETDTNWHYHAICVGDTSITSWDRWESDKEVENNWVLGNNVCLIPGNSVLNCRIRKPFTGAMAFVRRDILDKMAGELIDATRAGLEYTRINSEPMNKLLTGIRALGVSGLLECKVTAESTALMLAASVLGFLYRGARTGRPEILGRCRMRRVVEYIEARIGDQMTVTELAAVAALSPYHFLRSFQRTTGQSPLRYITAKRVEHAKLMLKNSAMIPIADIALCCGFCSQSHFTTAFKREAGVSPGEFRRLHLNSR